MLVLSIKKIYKPMQIQLDQCQKKIIFIYNHKFKLIIFYLDKIKYPLPNIYIHSK